MRFLPFAVVVAVCLSAFACGPAKQKGGGPKSASSAQSAKEKGGAAASSATSKGTASGADRDGVTCDSSLEDVAFCADDASMVVCTGGQWYVLDCSAVVASSFCGLELSSNTVDCWVDL